MNPSFDGTLPPFEVRSASDPCMVCSTPGSCLVCTTLGRLFSQIGVLLAIRVIFARTENGVKTIWEFGVNGQQLKTTHIDQNNYLLVEETGWIMEVLIVKYSL